MHDLETFSTKVAFERLARQRTAVAPAPGEKGDAFRTDLFMPMLDADTADGGSGLCSQSLETGRSES